MKLAEEKKIVLVASAMNFATGSPVYTKSINMGGYHLCTFLIDIGTMSGGNATLTVNSGAATATYTTDLAFKYAYCASSCLWLAAMTTPASGSDILAAETEVTAATGLEIVQATYLNHMLVVEVDASIMTDGEEWLSLVFTDSSSSAAGLATVFAILEPRYTSNRSATALA